MEPVWNCVALAPPSAGGDAPVLQTSYRIEAVVFKKTEAE